MQQHQPRVTPDYDRDFFAWTQHQAKLLRTLGKMRAAYPEGLDLAQVAEEIEGSGSADLNAVKSVIRQILVHLIKVTSDPDGRVNRHWRSEVVAFGADLSDRYTPSMRQLLDMQQLWSKALRTSEVLLQEHGSKLAPGIPLECPFDVETFVGDEFDFDAALSKLTSAKK